MTEKGEELVERLQSVGAERSRAEPHDDPKSYMRVYARLSREDGALMSEAATALSERDARIAELEGALEFYAQAWKLGHDNFFEPSYHLMNDCGERAKVALRRDRTTEKKDG